MLTKHRRKYYLSTNIEFIDITKAKILFLKKEKSSAKKHNMHSIIPHGTTQ
jgi:hypothetical protein